ncbi:MAG: hypothetical protein IJB79_06150 [Candidatus Gastranaerophilales bacterium]|nr:hypothetical protein [Candidatus Gastranaerophilales bacterium]
MDKRVIALVDCNNFFVACERLRKPELRDVPVCVLSNNDGCVVSRSNEAKRMGVEMGAPYFICKNQFKKVKFLSGDLTYYCEISKRVMDKLYDFTPDVEIYSIDEAFLDLTGLRKTFNCPYEEICERIVQQIKDEVGIDVSVGLSYSKVLAKLANDKAKKLQKIKIDKKTYKIGYRNIQKELKETLISDVWGVGKNTTALLKKHLIQTCFDFVSQDDVWIKKNLGKIGIELKQELLGNSIHKVESVSDAPKSISRSESFKEFQTDKNYIFNELTRHIHKVCKKLRDENLLASCVGVMLRTKDFQVFDCKINLLNPTNTEFELVSKAKEIFEKMFVQGVVYRSVGFFATKFTSQEFQQISLFQGEDIIKKQELSKSWDKLEEKFGKGILRLGK